MPMAQSRLKRFLESANPTSAPGALQALWPLYNKAMNRRYEIATVRIDAEPIIAAIADATGRRVDKIVIATSRDHEAFVAPPYGGILPFESSLGGALLQAHWDALKQGLIRRFGPEWPLAKDEIWSCLRSDVAGPLRLPFWDDPFEGPRIGVGESVMTSLFYFAAAAVVGDAERDAALEPLIRLLALAVPVAEDPTQRHAWMLALPPVAK